MSESGQTAETIAERVGKSAAWVRRHLALLKLDGKVIAAMRKNGLRFTQAEHVAKVLKNGSLSDALEAAKAMAGGQLSRRSAEGALRKTETSHKRSLNSNGDHYRASLAIESDTPLDDVRSRQLEELMTALDRIMTCAA